ncbi:MAG TPA: ElyC/SanA/YdcF family protein [Chitinophagales bacterium]|nr:ElyC/SanA/YdcF family protein [Chitinophagales bacterium]
MNYKRAFIALIVFSFFALAGFTIWANAQIRNNSNPFITANVTLLKEGKAGLLLGTSRNLKNGEQNLFFFNRIEAAVQLYNSGKIKVLIVSGDNSAEHYNEPEDMKQELIKRGIPENAIYLDYAGFRTLDSVIRAREIFGQQTFIIISQKFHNERAVHIARQNGIEAYGFNAADVPAMSGIKTHIREYFARDKVFIDLLLHKQPRFLGNKVAIE